MNDFLAQLDAQLSAVTSKTKLRSDREEAKKRSNNRFAPQAARERAKAELQSLDKQISAMEWQAVSTIALFTEQTCSGCSSVHHVFLQYMELHELISKPTTQRWLRKSSPDPRLPKETLIQPMLTHVCSSCCESHGFAIPSAKRLAPRKETITPSTTYFQEAPHAAAV